MTGLAPLELTLALTRLLVWEIALGALCFAAVRRAAGWGDRLVLWLALDIAGAALPAAALSFLGLNSRAAYLVLATAMLGAAWLLRVRTRRDGGAPPPGAAVFASALALTFMLLLAVRPISEPDSLLNLHFVFGWLENRTTPYRFAFHFVSFWELSYVPALTLASCDLFYWVQSLKPVLLLGGALALLARELRVPKLLSAVVISSALAFPHLWFQPSGVSSIKNDMAAAAGQAMAAAVALRALRARLSVGEWTMLGLAVSFVSLKYSGPVLLAAWAAPAVALAGRRLASRRVLAGLAACGVCWFLTAGHFYLHNFLAFGNPVYPFQLNLPGLHLPGLGDVSKTAILYSLGDPRLWRAFFLPHGGLSPGGLLFPAVFAAMLAVSAGFCLKAVRDAACGKQWRTPELVLSLFQVAVLAVYVRSFYSASASPGDLAYITQSLNSLRFIEGAVLVAEVFFAWCLLRARVPYAAVLALAALNGASRLWILGRDWSALAAAETQSVDLALTAVFGAALAALLASAWFLPRPRWKLPAAGVFALALLGACTALTGVRRAGWLPQWKPLYGRFYDGPGERIYLVVEDDYSEQALAHLPFKGARFQNVVETGVLGQAGDAPYLVVLPRGTSAPAAPPGRQYRVLAASPAGTLYARSQ